MVIVWLITLWICWHYHLIHQGKSFKGKFFSLCCFIKSRFHRSSGVFLYVRNFLHSCIYLSLSVFIYLSIYFKIVWPQVCFCFWAHRQHVAVVDVIVTRKWELSQVKSQIFVCERLGNFPQKIFAQRKFPDKISLYQWKAFKRCVVHFLKRCP